MLIYFSVENFRSIKSKVELDMQPAPRMRRHKNHVVDLKHKNKLKALRSAVMFGANASGKSNIIKAIEFAQNLIVKGTSQKNGIPVEPFKLAPEQNKISSFCFEFVISDRYYVYRFDLSSKKVESESLYYIDGEDELCVFNRYSEDEQFYFETDYTQLHDNKDEIASFKSLMKFTNDNQLFLNELIEKVAYEKFDDSIGINIFYPTMFFKNKLVVIFPTTRYAGIVSDLNSKDHHQYESALKAFDTGIESISSKKVPCSNFSDDIVNSLKEELDDLPEGAAPYINFELNDNQYTASYDPDDNDEFVIHTALAEHEVIDGKNVMFDISDESDGTRRLLDLLPAICSANESTIEYENMASRTYIIDEFDRSLHPNLSRAFLAKFLSCEVSLSKDQLIVTTHEDALLDNDLLRRDEIWFVQKEYDSSTHLYSLNDYAPRFDKNIQSDYLSGKFGSVPYIMSSYIKGGTNVC